jgi:hypothetical protein
MLAGLSPADRERVFPQLELVPLQAGVAPADRVDVQNNVYFPAGCVVSLMYPFREQRPVEVAVLANDGVIGLNLRLGDEVVPPAPVVQRPGPVYGLPDRLLQEDHPANLRLRLKILQYSHDLLVQMVQTSICQRLHTVEQQFCRWLLNATDCRGSIEVVATYELVASLLAVHPYTVGRAGRRLEFKGVISTRRRCIDVLDRARLALLACDCYTLVQQERQRYSSLSGTALARHSA